MMAAAVASFATPYGLRCGRDRRLYAIITTDQSADEKWGHFRRPCWGQCKRPHRPSALQRETPAPRARPTHTRRGLPCHTEGAPSQQRARSRPLPAALRPARCQRQNEPPPSRTHAPPRRRRRTRPQACPRAGRRPPGPHNRSDHGRGSQPPPHRARQKLLAQPKQTTRPLAGLLKLRHMSRLMWDICPDSSHRRRGRDSNPRTRLTPVTRFPVAPVQPLRHLSTQASKRTFGQLRRRRPWARGAAGCADAALPRRDRLRPARSQQRLSASRKPEGPRNMDLILAASRALAEDVGLLGVFLGLGIIANVILVYIAIQVHGEHRANRAYRSARERGETV